MKVSGLFILIFMSVSSYANVQLSPPYFENAAKIYSQWKSELKLNLEEMKVEFDSKVEPLNEQLNLKTEEYDKCQNFECADRLSIEIEAIKKTIQSHRKLYNKNVEWNKTDLLAQSKDLSLNALMEELKAITLKNNEFQYVKFSNDHKCGDLEYSWSVGLPAMNYMRCRNLEAEFKYKKRFYRVVIALGIKHGNVICSKSSKLSDFNTPDYIFNLPKKSFLRGAHPSWFFLGDENYSENRPQKSSRSQAGSVCLPHQNNNHRPHFVISGWSRKDDINRIGFRILEKEVR